MFNDYLGIRTPISDGTKIDLGFNDVYKMQCDAYEYARNFERLEQHGIINKEKRNIVPTMYMSIHYRNNFESDPFIKDKISKSSTFKNKIHVSYTKGYNNMTLDTLSNEVTIEWEDFGETGVIPYKIERLLKKVLLEDYITLYHRYKDGRKYDIEDSDISYPELNDELRLDNVIMDLSPIVYNERHLTNSEAENEHMISEYGRDFIKKRSLTIRYMASFIYEDIPF